MATSIATSLGISAISPVLKDLYEQSKEKFGTALSKWNNARTIQTLVTKVSAYERIKTIWQRDKDVKLSSFYYPSKVRFNTGIAKTITSLRDLPSIGSLVIQGTVGQGKSVFLRYLCIQELKANSSGRIPVFLELRKLDEKFDLEAAVFSTFKNLGFEITPELFTLYAESGKLVLLLDGFDELNEKMASKTITQLEGWSVEFPSLQIIVTSRPGAEIQKSSHFHVIRLAPLTAADHKPFMLKIGVKGETLKNLLAAIHDSPIEIQNLLTTPLLLTLLVLVYQVEHSVPSELPEFFKLLFVTVFSRHDGTKPAFNRIQKSGLNERKLELLFESFCFAVKRRKFRVSLSESDFNTAFEDASRFLQDKCTVEGFKHDIVKVACLLQEDGLLLSFVHKSLLDYFSAAFISSRTDKQAQQIYTSIREKTVGWRPTLQFLHHIDRYRYARDFAIPELTRSLEYLSLNLENSDKKKDSIKKFFIKTFGEAEIRLAKSEEGGIRYEGGFGPFYDPEFYFAETFINDILPRMGESIFFNTESDLFAAHPNVRRDPKNENEFLVPYKTFISREETKRFAQQVLTTHENLTRLKHDFESIVAYEDANAELLARFDVFEDD